MSMANESPKKKDRRDLLLLLLIVLLAFACMLTVGTLATRLAPQWMLEANMKSGINPDDLYTPQIGYIAPINEEILTQQFDDLYLTPGTQTPTETPINVTPTGVRTTVPTSTTVGTLAATATSIITPSPTATTLQTPSATFPPPPAPSATSVPSANLGITKSDSSSTYTPGNSISYQVVVTNAGPEDASGFRVVDNVPAAISGLTVSCAASGSASCGNNNTSGNSVRFDNAAVDAGASNKLTITISGTVGSGTTGDLINTANIVIPPSADFSDPNNNNNSATDTDTQASTPSADLAITKSDSSSTYTPGNSISYQVVVTNAGPDDASGFSIVDNVPAAISGLTVTCTASGSANCGNNNTSGNSVRYDNAAVSAGAGNKLTITISGTVGSGTTGNLVNTADIVIPPSAGFSDPDSNNNSSTDTDTRASTSTADLWITKVKEGLPYYLPGDQMIYTIQVSNAGPNDVIGATVVDTFAAVLSSPPPSWTCVASGGASCTASGTGNINDTIDLPAGDSVTYTITADIAGGASGDISNTAMVSPPAGISDPNNGNNSDTATTPPIPSTFCNISAGQVNVPDGGCFLIQTTLGGGIGNRYTITNTSTSGLDIFWTGLDENQTSGICSAMGKTLNGGSTLNQIAVRDNLGVSNLILLNTSGGSIILNISASPWLTGGCS